MMESESETNSKEETKMGILGCRVEKRKQYFVTKYKKALDGSENKRVRRVKYFNDYYIFGIKVYSKLMKIKRARDQYGLNEVPESQIQDGGEEL